MIQIEILKLLLIIFVTIYLGVCTYKNIIDEKVRYRISFLSIVITILCLISSSFLLAGLWLIITLMWIFMKIDYEQD